MLMKFGYILLTVGVVALLCGRRQIHQRDASELQGWLTKSGYQHLAHVFHGEGMVKGVKGLCPIPPLHPPHPPVCLEYNN